MNDYGNFKIEKGCNLLIGENATCAKIRQAISQVYYNSNGYDLVLFYFSGHGFEDGFKNIYIAPYDISKNEPFTCGLSLRELNQVLSSYYDFYKSVKKTTVLTILDHCYSGAGTISTKAGSASKSSYEDNLKDLTGEGRIVFASSGEDQESREVLDCTHDYDTKPHAHGVFTSHLIKGLEGEASDGDGIIRFDNLLKYVQMSMGDNKRQKTKLLVEQSQTANIKIAVISSKYTQFVIEQIKKANELLQEIENQKPPYLSDVRDAAKKIDEVLRRESRNNEAENLKAKVDEVLSPYRDEMMDWLHTHAHPRRKEIDKIIPGGLYYKLLELGNYLNFNKIMEIDEFNLSLLETLCDVIYYKSTNTDTFIQRIKSYVKLSRGQEAALGVPS